jgi:hypothetical protein
MTPSPTPSAHGLSAPAVPWIEVVLTLIFITILATAVVMGTAPETGPDRGSRASAAAPD